MNTGKKPACWIGLHKSEIHKEIDLTDIKGTTIGLVIINRCQSCGAITYTKIKTVEPSYN